MWVLLLGIVLIIFGILEIRYTVKYMHYLRTDAGPGTSPFALSAVYTSGVIGVIGIIVGIGVIMMAASGKL